MSMTSVLMDEHRVIERVLACLDEIVLRCVRDSKLDAGAARDAIDFLEAFADRGHHGKEEVLLDALERRGFATETGPTAIMRMEHAECRRRLDGMIETVAGAGEGRKEDVERFVGFARGYAALLRDHIDKEDHTIFPMAEQTLDDAAQQRMEKRFADLEERQQGGAGMHASYVDLADRLAERLGVPRVAVTVPKH